MVTPQPQSTVRALLRPGMVLTHLLVIAIAVSLFNLGLWQVRRHAEVALENQAIVRLLADEPINLLDALEQPITDLRPVSTQGTYASDHDVTLSPRSRNGRPGSDVLTPLRLPDGRAVIVNRGWIPLDTEAPPPSEGPVQIEARLRVPQRARQLITDDAGQVTVVGAVRPQQLEGQVDGLVSTAWLEVVDDAALSEGVLPRPAEPVVLEGGNHLSYAFQWFAFMAIGVIGYPLLLRRRLLNEPPHRAEQVPMAKPE